MREADVEKHLKKEVERRGGLCLKFVSPGWAGAPDRIVITPHGWVTFVELKAPGEKPRELQRYRREQLERCGQHVAVIDSKEAVTDLIEEVMPDGV